MSERALGDLTDHLVRSTPLPAAQVERVIAEVLAYLDETVEAFVRRRHRELQRDGLQNDEIFARLAAELETRRFCAPELSVRQLRRLVYG